MESEPSAPGGDLLSIGQLARASGLTVSALRFYDSAGVLPPTVVDPATGYRWYAEAQIRSARLVAALRRVGMPLVDMVAVLGRWPDPVAVRRLLGAHLRRLEAGLADARRELSRVEALLDSEENPMPDSITRRTVRCADLASALDAVRFAAGRDPQFPALCGILFDIDSGPGGQVLRLVATDRYRLAVAESPVRDLTGPAQSAIAPLGLADEIRSALAAAAAVAGVAAGGGEALVVIGGGTITVTAGGRETGGPALDQQFPDFRRALGRQRTDAGPVRAIVDVPAFRQALLAGEPRRMRREHDGVMCDVAVLAAGAGAVTVGSESGSGRDAVGVNREFLLEALAAGGRDQLVLELDGPIMPLAIRVPDDDGRFSVLMPTCLT